NKPGPTWSSQAEPGPTVGAGPAREQAVPSTKAIQVGGVGDEDLFANRFGFTAVGQEFEESCVVGFGDGFGDVRPVAAPDDAGGGVFEPGLGHGASFWVASAHAQGGIQIRATQF